MKTLAYFPILYGSEYLGYSMASIVDHVDHIAVFYSSLPTYGHKGSIANPDTKEDIQEICDQFGAELIDITSHHINAENKHRAIPFTYARKQGYDIVLAVDYDEVWQDVDKAIEAAKNGSTYSYQIAGSRWYHFWKSFDEVNRDGFAPHRLFNLKYTSGTSSMLEVGTIYHFGYAISDQLLEYKLSCHGHKSEIPIEWKMNKWYNYQKGETTHLHPASNDVWIETEYFDKKKLPEFMKTHPMY